MPKLELSAEGRNCCFKTCWERATEFDLEEFPACKKHRDCLNCMYLLDDIGYDNAVSLPDDLDWLSARWFAELRERGDPENRSLYDRTMGETPLFPIFLHFFSLYLPIIASLGPANALSESGDGPLENPSDIVAATVPMARSQVPPETRSTVVDPLDGKSTEGTTPIERLSLSERTYNALVKAEVASVEQLMLYRPEELKRIRGIGRLGVEEIVKKLAAR